jgi:hypothetical protein
MNMKRKLEFEILEDRTLPSSGLSCRICCPPAPPAPSGGEVVAATSMEGTSAVNVGVILPGIHSNHYQAMLLMPHGGAHVNHNQTLKRIRSRRRKKS